MQKRHEMRASQLTAMQAGLTLVHFSARPEPFCSHLPVSPCLIDWGKTMHPNTQRIPQNVLTLSQNVDECQLTAMQAGRHSHDLPFGSPDAPFLVWPDLTYRSTQIRQQRHTTQPKPGNMDTPIDPNQATWTHHSTTYCEEHVLGCHFTLKIRGIQASLFPACHVSMDVRVRSRQRGSS